MSKDIWLPRFNDLSPAYEIFSWLSSEFLTKKTWPSLEDYNSISELSIRTNPPIQFVPQAPKAAHFNDGYEQRIYLASEVQTRNQNWHDFFNMLIWYTFPKVKLKLNELQFKELIQRAGSDQLRSKLENFLTLFDENGVIILCSDENLLHLIKTMQWKELFWYQRNALMKQARCFVFGHSLHEKLLQPYIGMVGHSILIRVDPTFFDKTLPQQIEEAAYQICNLNLVTMTSQNLHPVPILGWPNWFPEAQSSSFYDNKNYFRASRRI